MMKVLWNVGIALCLMAGMASAQQFETEARAAIIVDYNTGIVLFEKNADEPLPPASMSKLMTLYMAFEAIGDGRLTLETRLPVSEHAMSFGGSTMFLDTTDRPTVDELLNGIVVLSGNDACVVVAEALSPDGTELGFARQMTERAHELGMARSNFVNSSGWPELGHVMSMRDLAILAEHLITDFPEFYPLFAKRQYEFDGRAPSNTRNRNPLLGIGIGADGLKTGRTQEAGFGLVGSAIQNNRRIIFVVTGLESEAARARESEKMVNWALRNFTLSEAFAAGEEVARADVFMGAQNSVGLAPVGDVTFLAHASNDDGLEARAVFDGPLRAPIEAGQTVGQLVIAQDGMADQTYPLVTTEAVAEGGFGERLRVAASRAFADMRGMVSAQTASAE